MCASPSDAGRGGTPSPPGSVVPDSLGLTFIRVEPGTFLQGNAEGKLSERPVHRVTLTRPYDLGRHEVTRKQWRLIMGTEPWKGQLYAGEGDDLPATYVNWYDVQAFIEKLNQADSLHRYRLPTEAEWEYAAYAGTGMKYGYTADPDSLCVYANIADSTASEVFPDWEPAPCRDGFAYSAPVESLLPNRWGFYDMVGNVWEWTNDWFAFFPDSALTDPVGPPTGERKVLKGNSWDAFPETARISNRFAVLPHERSVLFGFRLVRERRR